MKFTLLHVSICSKLVRNFSNTLGFVSLCRHASLLTTTFSFSQVHLQTDQNVKCMIIMRIEAISFQIYNILKEIIENNFPFSSEFGRPKASIFCSRGVPGRLDALLAKSLVINPVNSRKPSCNSFYENRGCFLSPEKVCLQLLSNTFSNATTFLRIYC